MMPPYPINAPEISVQWPIEEGGFGVTARTDAAGLPYIGLFPLHPRGFPAGQPNLHQRPRLLIGIVAGYDGHLPINVFVDVELTPKELLVRINMPNRFAAKGYSRYLKARWGSESARLKEDPTAEKWQAEFWPHSR